MLHVITGGSGSGKSAYAEGLVQKTGPGRRIYIATMIPYGEEGRQRVLRHRALRREKQFETAECYTDLAHLDLGGYADAVLLECISNLVANEMFEPDGAKAQTVEAVCRGVQRLQQQTGALFIVTNEIFSDGISYDAETALYLEQLGIVNQRLAQMADTVTEVVCGIPNVVKERKDETVLEQS